MDSKESSMKKLAKITSARLEIQDRGILSFYVSVNYEDGFCQNVGGIALDEYDKETKTRVGTAYGCEMIRQILLCFGVNDFSEIKDKIIYVVGDGDGFSFKPKGFETLKVDGDVRKVCFDEIAERMISEVAKG